MNGHGRPLSEWEAVMPQMKERLRRRCDVPESLTASQQASWSDNSTETRPQSSEARNKPSDVKRHRGRAETTQESIILQSISNCHRVKLQGLILFLVIYLLEFTFIILHIYMSMYIKMLFFVVLEYF